MQAGSAPVPPQEEQTPPPKRGYPWGGLILWLLLTPVILVLMFAGFIWFAMPSLMTPSGSTTYAKPAAPVTQWLMEAAPTLLRGQEATITINADEAAALLASLAGDDIRVRDVAIDNNLITVRAVIDPPPGVPDRFQKPWAVQVQAATRYLPDGRLRAELTSVRLGPLPVPLVLVRGALVRSGAPLGPVDPLLLPVEGNLARWIQQISHGAVKLKDVRFENGSVTLLLESALH